MTLQYGLTGHNEYVHISEVRRGKSDLHCPYCNGLLIARKGEIVAHHFAHAGETCLQSESANASIPVYDNFNLHLPGHVVAELRKWAEGGASRWDANADMLVSYELLDFRDWRDGRYSLTHKGKLVLGQLSLMLFSQFQEPRILEQYNKLQANVRAAWADREYALPRARLKGEIQTLKAKLYDNNLWAQYHYTERWQVQQPLRQQIAELESQLRKIPNTEAPYDLETALADLRLYRLQWKRILDSALYFLEVTHTDGVLYKIGVTTRADVNERVAEVQSDVTTLLGECSIQVLGIWPHRGNVEFYFKYRYLANRAKLGKLTEYFQFDDVKPVMRDLRRMKEKVPTDLEMVIWRGENSAAEEQIRLDLIEAKRRIAIRAGMEKAAAKGKEIGRPRGKEDVTQFLAKPEIVKVREALALGMSLRQTAAAAGVSVSTVRKVKQLICQL